MLGKEYPLIEKKSVYELDCMKKIIDVREFCAKKEADNPYLTRAIVKNNKVFCQSAKRVVVKYECEGNKDKYCNDVEVGCFLIKEKLAMRLKIAHQSLLQNKVLNCHFDIHSSKLEL